MKAAKHSVADASPRPFTLGVTGASAQASEEAAFEAARATIGGPHRLEPVYVTRRLVVFLLLLAALAGVCALTWSIAWQRGLDTLRQSAAARVDRTTAELKSTLDRYEYLLTCSRAIRSCRKFSPIQTPASRHARTVISPT